MPHNPEFESFEYQDNKEKDKTGYSEQQLDIDAEIQAGEWQSLQRYRTYRQRSRQWKIIAMYKAISNRLEQLVDLYYKLVGPTPQKGERLLIELRKLRKMQEILLQCMVWEPKGQLEKDMIPLEVWELIE